MLIFIKKLHMKEFGKYKRRMALYRCGYCGENVEKVFWHGHNPRRSCGCTKHSASYSKLYAVWTAMKQRCYNKNNKRYKDYGGRGIVVCDEWGLFSNFKKWAESNGYKEGLQIDRKNNDKGYYPRNCHFVTNAENNRNKTVTVLNWYKVNLMRSLYELGFATGAELSKIFNIQVGTVYGVIYYKKWKK